MPADLTYGKSSVVRFMAWCHQEKSRYLMNQCWATFLWGTQWVNGRSWFHPNCFGDFDISSSYIALYRGQWRGSLMCYLICAWINGWANNREAGYLRRIRAHYDVIVMIYLHRYAHWPRFKWISLAAVYTFRKDPHNVLGRIESIFNIKQSYLGVLTYICFVYSIF